MAVHASILTWKIPWTEKCSPIAGHKELDTTERLTYTHTHTHTHMHTPVQRLSWALNEIVFAAPVGFSRFGKGRICLQAQCRGYLEASNSRICFLS